MKCLELELPFNVRVEVYIADSQTAIFAARQLDFYLKSNRDVDLSMIVMSTWNSHAMG
jgi:hypothetical protein